MINSENVKIFAGTSNRDLAKKIAEKYGLPLGKADVVRFKDGEVFVKIDETVRGRDVFVVQSTSEPVNENLMELLIFVDALKRASAKSINVIIPYYGYARQDRKSNPREPITSKLVANLLTKSGATRIIAMDLHADQIQGFFDIPADDITANGLIADYFKHKEGLGEIVVVSPDHGGAVRARNLANALGAPIAIIDKRRPRANVSQVMHIIGDVAGRDCVLVDDMIDTGGTLCKAAEALKERGAKRVFAYATHPIFSGNAANNLRNSVIDEVVVCDTIPLSDEIKSLPNVRTLTLSGMLAEAIRRISNEE